VGLLDVAIEVRAEVGRKTVDVSAELEQGILGPRPGQRSNGHPDGLRFRPPSGTRPRIEAVEVPVVEIDLEWPCHDPDPISFMKNTSTGS
jgi:hypothetical protein